MMSTLWWNYAIFQSMNFILNMPRHDVGCTCDEGLKGLAMK